MWLLLINHPNRTAIAARLVANCPARRATAAIQADWNWSETNLSTDVASICGSRHAALADLAGETLPNPVFADAMRWRFAQPLGSDLGHLWNGDIGLGTCGEWLSYGFVEHAWRSGRNLGDAIARNVKTGRDVRAEG